MKVTRLLMISFLCLTSCYGKRYFETSTTQPDRRTLMYVDLNFDSLKDVLVGYHALFTNPATANSYNEVYLQVPFTGKWRKSRKSVLNGLTNPSFYLAEQRITSFWIDSSEGFGEEYKWDLASKKWKCVKQFEVVNAGANTVWKVYDSKKKLIDSLIAPFNFYPPAQVLKVDSSYWIAQPD